MDMAINGDGGRTRRPAAAWLALGLVLLIAVAAAASYGAGPAVAAVRDAAGEAGLLGALVFALAYAALTVALVPGSLMTLAAGALFGGVGGTLVTVVGATAGATLAFIASRRLSQARIEALAGPRLRDLDVRLSARGFTSVLVLRLVPLAPFNVLNYAFGATSVRLRDYVGATAIGIVPATFTFAAAGAAAADPGLETVFVGLGSLAVLLIVTTVVRRRSSPPEPIRHPAGPRTS